MADQDQDVKPPNNPTNKMENYNERVIDGMDITTIQWETTEGMPLNFKRIYPIPQELPSESFMVEAKEVQS
jgi:hypothetical protein